MSDFLLCWIVMLLAANIVKGMPEGAFLTAMFWLTVTLAAAFALYVVLWVIRFQLR